MSAPTWLRLLSPLPSGANVQRAPVATAEQIASGTAGPIAGWHSVRAYLSDLAFGLRHVSITLDQHDRLLSAGDYVVRV
ncbi:MAG TPA: hypothetical protein VF491_12805, partial [Vicinamibacterales bacterium]